MKDLERWFHGETWVEGMFRCAATIILVMWLAGHALNALQTGNWHRELCQMSVDPTSKDCR